MKMIRFMAVLVAVLVSFFALCAEGQTLTGGPFPDRLPIGNELQVWNYVVTNRDCDLAFSLNYTNSTNALVKIPWSASNARFQSYAEFQALLMSVGMQLYTNLTHQTDIASIITFKGRIIYPYPDGSSWDSYSVVTNVGPVSGINSNTFLAIRPDWTRMIMPIPGLIHTNIEVLTSPMYYWPLPLQPASVFVPPHPEHTAPGLLILNQWYLTQDYRARITLKLQDGRMQAYLEDGNPPRPAVTSIARDASNLDIDMSKSSDALVQRSPDLLNWSSVTNLMWPTPLHVNIPISHGSPRQFYQVIPQ